MATPNGYYTTTYRPSDSSPYYEPEFEQYGRRNDAPLPPLPSTSPSDDRNYHYSRQPPTRSYSGASGHIHEVADPYADENAIPMSGRKPKHHSATTISPILPHQVEDPFVRDVEPRKKRKRLSRDGWFKGRIPWVVYVLSAVELIVFIAEFVKMGVLTGTPIELHPSFNPMIGPSPYVLINMGARYQPCMHNMANVQNATMSISWPCPNATSATGDSVSCTLSELCGFSGVPNPHVGGSINDKPAPNQWWRFIVPIFLHAGIIHIAFNLLLQLTLGADVEKLIGSIRFTIVYFAAGIFGFVLGGNFAANGIASCGCSGSLFGILAITLLDLLYTWHQREGPIKDLLFILIDVIIAFVLGLLPGLDNFSHIGGFLMGLVLGVCILRSPTTFSRRTSQDVGRYSGLSNARQSTSGREDGLQSFFRNPIAFFQNRRGIWWVWWLVRAAALVGCLIGFVLLLKNFYQWRTGCTWCKYLSCLPVTVGGENWCNVGNLDFTPVQSPARRDLLENLASEAFRPAERLW
ncbi:hypothetical protein BAUCODRAFT_121073 [Baudoinia panamericana UAMH 10762]|uniref:Rhomboid-type serine protease n=1 Tax=Baudoinia panamericana (strain UAMH 10762) TaxID=717646 RepID=M2MNC6_BAUPA|nr:uncharacterized protein BAUCODRAFT_121073 [Baudoinia panamericana UAMH 10762]EMC98186.1 hypothetical protein BAUCODRAFT_121073 [Baudoinia panamericana UAMH 10762]